MVEWHFKHVLGYDRVWIASVSMTLVAGYAIFDKKDNPKLGHKRVRLKAPLGNWRTRRAKATPFARRSKQPVGWLLKAPQAPFSQ